MKKETRVKNKKVLWLAIGIAAVLVVAGVVLGIVLGLGNNSGSEQVGGRPDLYWNVDRATYFSEDSGVAASSREPAADGYYYIRFAYNGEYVEYPVADKKLVNVIDSMDLISLVFDGDGMIVDMKLPNEVALEVGIKVYFQSATEDKIVTNTSITLNGMKNDVVLGDLAQIYNVSNAAENVGEIIDTSKLEIMDTMNVYANKLGEITHVYLVNRSAKSPIYWRCEQMYADKKTTRVPDENGVYTVDFYCDGEVVSLKFKDEKLVTLIDSTSRYSPCFSFTFDEDGYVKEKVDTGLATRTVQRSARYDITNVADGLVETTKIIGSNAGVTDTFRYDENTIIYDASKSAAAEGRGGKRVEDLKVGDRIVAWSDANGMAKIVYVSNRLVDSPAYYVTARKYSSATKETTREPVGGRYEIELLREGETKNAIYWTEDKALMTMIDADINMCVGLKVTEDNEILAVYDVEALFGNTSFCRGRYVTDINSIIGSFATITDPDNPKQGVLGAGCKIYNVSSVGEYGTETTLKYGDYVYAWKQPSGEIIHVYVSKRLVDYDVYYNLERKYDSEKLETKREAEDGWYIYTMAVDGKVETVKTNSKKMADFIDSVSPGMLALDVDSNGVIKDAQHGYLSTGGRKRFSGYFVKSFNSDGTVTLVADTTSEKEYIMTLAEDCKIWNVCDVYDSHKGEATKLKIGDKVSALTNMRDEAAVIYVRTREVDKLYFNMKQMYNSTDAVTTRVKDANGWYWYDLLVDGQVKKFKTNSDEIANKVDYYGGAFGLVVNGDEIKCVTSPAYVKGIMSSEITNWDVTAINGNKVTVTYHSENSKNNGQTKTITLASNVKIYDVSPTAESFGKEVKLQVGDRIRTYINDQSETVYIYIRFHDTREKGAMGYCEHCDKVVYWTPWVGGSFSTAGGHFYLPTDITTDTSSSVGRSTKNPVSNVVLDLNGHTYCRTGSRAIMIHENATFNLFDSVGGGKLTATGNKDLYGGVIYVSKGTFNLYSGILTPAENNTPATRGGVVYMTGGGKAVFNMYGGTIVGGETAPSVEYPYSQGGNVFVNSGDFNMYGGTISGGTSSDGKVKGENGKESTVRGYGGNIYSRLVDTANVNIYGGSIDNGSAYGGGNISGAGQWNFAGGTISGGKAAYRGGSIYVNGGNWNFSGVTIKGGESANRGGNIYITVPSVDAGEEPIDSVVTVSGGIITGGKAGTDGANIAVVSGSIFNLTGGTVSNGSNYLGTGSHTISGGKLDGKTEYKGGTLTLSGTPVFTNLEVSSGKYVTLGELKKGANISVYADGVFTNELTNAQNYIQYFTSLGEGTQIDVVGNALAAVKEKLEDPNAYTARCEHCGEEVKWSEWAYLSGSGHYYLANDVSITEETVAVANGEDIVLDLHGKTATATDVRAFDISGTLSIVNSTGNGTLTGNGLLDTSTVDGGIVRVNNGGTLNLFSGTISLADTHNAIRRGGVILANSGGQINIHGGTVSGGEVTQRGGNIYLTGGTLNVSGGTVTGGRITESGTLDYGGNIGVASDGSVNISGGTVSDGSVYLGTGTHTITGGAVDGMVTVYASDNLTVSGAPTVDYLNMYNNSTIIVGQLETTAHIRVSNVGVFTGVVENAENYVDNFEAMTSGYEVTVVGGALAVTVEVADETDNYDAACPHCDGATATWSKWTGAATSGHFYMDGPVDVVDGQILVDAGVDMVLDLKGQTITATDFRAFSVKGVLSILDSAANGTVIGNGIATESENGGVILVNGSSAVFNLYSGTVKMTQQPNSIKRGGVAYVTGGATFNMFGGTIADGVSRERGGNITVVSNSHLNISGGQITGGSPYSLYIGSGTHTISGGQIAGSVNYVDGTLTVSGAPEIAQMIIGSKMLTVGELTNGAQIAVDAAGVFTGELTNAQDMVQYFAAFNSNEFEIASENNALSVVAKTTGGEGGGESTDTLCPCGCGQKLDEIQWIELSGTEARTDANGVTVTGIAHYRLVGNYTNVADTAAVSNGKVKSFTVGDATTETKMVFDLNGFALVNTTDARIFQMTANATLFIMDSQGGGTIQDGSVANSGGVCYIVANSEVNMYGGTILSSSGASRTGRGPIYLYRGGTFNMYSGTINGCNDTNQASPYGGTIYANANSSSGAEINLNIYGGTINGGKGNDAIYMNNASKNINLNVEGGQVNGLIKFSKDSKYSISLKNAPVISELDLTSGMKLSLVELSQGADITVKADKGAVIAEALTNANSYAPYFGVAGNGMGVVAEDNKLVVAEMCPCGCGVALSKIQWTDISLEDGISSDYYIEQDGHYRVTKDVRGNSSNLIRVKAANAVVDLNGKAVANKGRAFYHADNAGGNLYILDIAGGATVTTIDYDSSNKNNGALTGCWIATKGNVSVYGGSWNSTTSVAGTSTNTTRMIYVRDGSISIYGGTFDATGVVGGHGIMGAYRETACTFNISGGTFIGGNGNGVGDVWTVNAASTLNISGGTFQGKIYAKEAGSVVKLSGAPVISDLDLTQGAKVTLGELTEGASIAVTAGDNAFSVANEKAAAYATYFDAVADGKTVQANADNQLVIVDEVASAAETEGQSVFSLMMRSVANFFGFQL